MPVVTTDGFIDDHIHQFLPSDSLPNGESTFAVDLPNDANATELVQQFNRIHTIRIAFSSTADGRGFSLAKRLRNLGYKGRLRAQGPIISDQFRYALACGFNEVEIDKSLADRQPASHWIDTENLDYRHRLTQSVSKLNRSDNVHYQSVLDVQHYTQHLFRFRIARPDSFRFNAGEFVIIGLEIQGKPIFRAYSICSASYDEYLEFYSIKVPNGEFTKRLQWIKPGDTILLKKKSTGSLVTDALLPGKRLFLHATGTGIAPFSSLIQEPCLYQQFENVILTQTCRQLDELQYANKVVEYTKTESIVQEQARQQLYFLGSTTQQESPIQGRITDLIKSHRLYKYLDIAPLDPEHDRLMICGSLAFNKDMRNDLMHMGFTQGSLSRPGSFVLERAFVG